MQLRPKVEQYELRLESRRGFELDVSLFERLTKSGYPHTTLELQHRMPPQVRDGRIQLLLEWDELFIGCLCRCLATVTFERLSRACRV